MMVKKKAPPEYITERDYELQEDGTWKEVRKRKVRNPALASTR